MILTPEEIRENERNPYVPIKHKVLGICNDCRSTNMGKYDCHGKTELFCVKCGSINITHLNY